MTEPKNALLTQYRALVETEGAVVRFTEDGVNEIARIAADVNQRMENIGARRLHTVLTTLLEDIMFQLPESGSDNIVIDANLVGERLAQVVKDEDLRRYIL